MECACHSKNLRECVCRSEREMSDPEHCTQERWLEEDAEFWKGPANGNVSSGDKSAEVVRGRRYLPFGDGVRSCVGQSLAKMNYTATLALLLSHFSFRLADRVSACAHAHDMSSSSLESS